MAPSCMTASAKPTVAVIGAGLAGLSAAWLLSQKYTVTLYERHDRAGMGVFTSDYYSNGLHTRIDVPLRIFTPGYYPNLFALYQHLNIEMEASDHAAQFQYLTTNNQLRTFFQYINARVLKSKFRCLAPNSLNSTGLFLALSHRYFFYRIKKDIVNSMDTLSRITFADYLSDRPFNEQFIEHMLMPALAATLTCDFDSVKRYPADLVLQYLTSGIMEKGIVRAKQGVDAIVPKLTGGYTVECGHELVSMQEVKNTIKLTLRQLHTDQLVEKNFDKVVLASQADVAANILASSKHAIHQQQAKLLQRIPMETSSMVLHTDQELVSNAKHASPVSYVLAQDHNRGATTVDLTKAFSTYQTQQRVFQTWHPIKQPAKDTIICQAEFTRPLVTLDSREAVKQLQALNPCSAVKVCGSYMANRFPLLDAAVESSVNLARELGVMIPWENSSHISVEDSYEKTKSTSMA